MKSYTLNYTNPTEDEMMCTLPSFKGRWNYTIKKFMIHSDNEKNLNIDFKINGGYVDLNKPIMITTKSTVLFKIQPWSNVTITLYPSLTIWQRIKNIIGI